MNNQRSIMDNEVIHMSYEITQSTSDQNSLACYRQITGQLCCSVIGGVDKIGLNSMKIRASNGSSLLIDDGVDILQGSISNAYFDISLYKDFGIKVVLITHMHEDHIGGLSKKIDKLNKIKDLTIVTSEITASILEKKLKKYTPRIVIAEHGKKIVTGFSDVDSGFEIIGYDVDHSCLGAMCFSIKDLISGKSIIHSGDFRGVFPSESYENKSQYSLCFIESTNAFVTSDLPNEKDVKESLYELFDKIGSKMIVPLFASEHERIINIIRWCLLRKKTFALKGRAVIDTYDWLMSMNFFTEDEKIKIMSTNVGCEATNGDLILCTGALGQPMTGIFKICDEICELNLQNQYSIIISASCIPGNEKQVNDLYKYIADKEFKNLYTFKNWKAIHASGHANIRSLGETANLINAKMTIPVHGDIAQRYQVCRATSCPSLLIRKGCEYDIDGIKIEYPGDEFYNKYLKFIERNVELDREDAQKIIEEREALAKSGVIVIHSRKEYTLVGAIDSNELSSAIKWNYDDKDELIKEISRILPGVTVVL